MVVNAMERTVRVVTVRTGHETYEKNGRVGARVLFGEKPVCARCSEDCRGLACPAMDWDSHAYEVRDGSCEHCLACEGEKAEQSCHDDADGHVCELDDDERCTSCTKCEECYEDCCYELDGEEHLAAVHAIRRVGGSFVCPAGHEIDINEVEGRQARGQMVAAGVEPML